MQKTLKDFKTPLRVSSNITFYKMVTVAVTLAICSVSVKYLDYEDIEMTNIILLLGAILFMGYFWYSNWKVAVVHIDQEHFYVSFGKTTQKHRFIHLKSLKMLPDEIGRKNFWILEYYDKEEMSSVKFLQRGYTFKYTDLIYQLAKENNNNITYKNYTYTFDKDV